MLQQIPTASYCIVLDHKGEMFCGIGDMDCMDHVTPSLVMEHADTIRSSPLVVVEANMSVETIHSVCMLCNEVNVPVLYEPTAVQKACRVVTAGVHSLVKYATPNLAELVAIYKGIVHSGKIDIEDVHDLTREEKLSRCLQHIPAVVNHIPNLYIKLGCDGVVVAQKDASTRKGYSVWHYQAASDHLLPVNVVSVSGAGDSFVGTLASSIIKRCPTDIAIKSGLRAAYMSLLSEAAISENISTDLLNQSALRDWAPWQPVRLV